MAVLYIDNKPYEVDGHSNCLAECLSLGFDLPYFCWHPAMGSVGACRQCAVKQYKDEDDTEGKLVMACMTPCSDGTRISIADEQARAFRAQVVEWLMQSHPHDCPICDEGGECHLQDMTVMTGHVYRRNRFHKRTFRNQYLGPFINHEMNRCITCYRCVRFYRDYAGGTDLQEMASKNHVYFGRHQDGTLENVFSGNLVEVCPTGVFTDRTLKSHYTRKWDLTSAPSVCPHCGLGCNTIAGERYGGLRRILNRYHHDVNGYFICDRGRFGYDFVNGEARLRKPLRRRTEDAGLDETDPDEALDRLAARLRAKPRMIGIGSPRASLESNHALRELVGRENFHLGLSAADQRLLDATLELRATLPARAPTLPEVEAADAVLILGEDLTNTAPRLALAVRQATRQAMYDAAEGRGVARWQDTDARNAGHGIHSPLIIVSPDATPLDDAATETLRAAPEETARLAFAVAHELDSTAPAPDKLNATDAEFARRAARALRQAKRPVLITGYGAACEAVLRGARNVALALRRLRAEPRVAVTVPECNTLGVGLLGGRPLEEAMARAEAGSVDLAIVLENDLFRRAESGAVTEFLKRAGDVVVLDHTLTPTAERATLALPAATFAEGDGTLVNAEGRAQRFYRAFWPQKGIQPSWRWLQRMLEASGRPRQWRGLDDVAAACAQSTPSLSAIAGAAPSVSYRSPGGMRLARAPYRYSGRTAMTANIDIREQRPPNDPDSPFSFSMEGHYAPDMPAALLPYVWAPGWNSAQALKKFQQEVGGGLRGGDAGVRLLEPGSSAAGWSRDVPAPRRQRKGEWTVVPLHHIFGEEELSARAPAVAERAPGPYLALNAEDAAALSASEGDLVRLDGSGAPWTLPLHIRPALPSGVAGLPVGLQGLGYRALPQTATLSRADDE